MKVVQQVMSFEPSSNKPDAWLKLKVLDKEGKERQKFLKSDNQKAIVKSGGVGWYEFDMEKEGEYYEVKNITFQRPLGVPPSQGGSEKTASQVRDPKVADVNVVIQNRAITAQVALKVAGEVVCKAIEHGAFTFAVPKEATAAPKLDFSAAADAAQLLAGNLMAEAGRFVKGTPDKPAEPAQPSGSADPEGA